MSATTVIVIGGGLVGAAAALALQQQGYVVTLIEPVEPQIQRGELGVDIRNVALNPQSQLLLSAVGAWDDALAVPYQGMEVWEESGTGCMNFTAASVGRDELGWLVEMSPLQAQLYQLCQQRVKVESSAIERLEIHGPEVRVTTASGHELTADFVVAADGADSRARRELGISVQQHPVGQHALATVVRTAQSHGGIARQRFLREGPLALLPAANMIARDADTHLVSVVWSQSEAHAQQRKSLDAKAFCKLLTRVSEGALGEVLEVDQRFSFPLTQQLAQTFVYRQHMVLLGDAARVVHPLAGLGVNLGFEDVLALLVVTEGGDGLRQATRRQTFARQRLTRSRHMIKLLALLQQTYGESNPWLTWMRNLATHQINQTTVLKQQIMREAMGLGPISQVDQRITQERVRGVKQ